MELLKVFITDYAYTVWHIPYELCQYNRIGVVEKVQLEKTRSWKARQEIRRNEIGKFGPKLESDRWSWKVLLLLISNFPTSAKLPIFRINFFPTWTETFRLQSFHLHCIQVLSNRPKKLTNEPYVLWKPYCDSKRAFEWGHVDFFFVLLKSSVAFLNVRVRSYSDKFSEWYFVYDRTVYTAVWVKSCDFCERV